LHCVILSVFLKVILEKGKFPKANYLQKNLKPKIQQN